MPVSLSFWHIVGLFSGVSRGIIHIQYVMRRMRDWIDSEWFRLAPFKALVTLKRFLSEARWWLYLHLLQSFAADPISDIGRGFAFVGSQVPLVVDDHPFYVDLLFYHIRLHCYFVIELKDWRVPAGVCWQTGLLSLSDRWNHADAYRHDLRRTCAKLCRKNGGDLEQIKFLLGHSSIQTTERYLGSEQEIVIAVNDNLGL